MQHTALVQVSQRHQAQHGLQNDELTQAAVADSMTAAAAAASQGIVFLGAYNPA